MNRRAFLTISAAGALGLLRDPRDAAAQARSAPAVPYGSSRLGISDDDRDGTLYIPKSYKPGVPVPVMMMLHGFAGSGDGVRGMFPLAEEFGVVMIAPESRGLTWGRAIPGFDADVRYLGPAYRHVANLVDIDETRVALGGVSDGAGYALSMGLAYGDSFNHLIILMAGQMIPYRHQGKPRIFMAHGVDDSQMPIDKTARLYVPKLKADGYDLTYHEYQGGHRVPPAEIRAAFEWFAGKQSQ
jgi:poly(3-hydroxybutyrate) depolymerase